MLIEPISLANNFRLMTYHVCQSLIGLNYDHVSSSASPWREIVIVVVGRQGAGRLTPSIPSERGIYIIYIVV